MTRRNATTSACTNGDALGYDQENRLTSITVGANTTTYVYDGDGNRVKKTVNGVSTFYVGNHYEVTNGVATRYYYFGKQRVAMKVGNAVTYLHGDHLGSTSVTTNASGQCTSAQWYYAYGNLRTPAPTTPCSGTPATDFAFTGQRRDASAGLLFYNARYYDPTNGRFVSADTIVPSAGNPQTLNRYAYAYNNPLRYNDPTGHDAPDIINFLGEFSTGAANEAWTNIAWFIPGHENLQVKAGESGAMTAGRVLGDVIALGIGIDETIIGGGMIGSGAALCGTAVLCVAGAPDMALGFVVGGAGIGTAGSAINNGGKNLNNLLKMAGESNTSGLRQDYENRVRGLADVARKMRAEGRSPEEIARTLHAARRALGVEYKNLTPSEILEQIYERNLTKYGDKLYCPE
jgi:RHS repeat-associated protein